MRPKPYTVIFILLTSSVLGALLLQAFWIKKFYDEKQASFNNTVYSALELVAEELRERENIRAVQKSVSSASGVWTQKNEQLQLPHKVSRSKSGNQVIIIAESKNGSEKRDTIIVSRSGRNDSGTGETKSLVQINRGLTSLSNSLQKNSLHDQKNRQSAKTILDSLGRQQKALTEKLDKAGNAVLVSGKDLTYSLKLVDSSLKTIEHSGALKTLENMSAEAAGKSRAIVRIVEQMEENNPDSAEVKQLLDRLMVEVRVNEGDVENKDTLGNIIRRKLEQKGVFSPFEFALRKINTGADKLLASSGNFDSTKTSFKSDLSANKVFRNHRFLFLQFPALNNMVISSMKNVLLLCGIFSLILLAAFYYSIRLIMRQKKLGDMKNDFINNMTHELKTPIATISLATDAISHPDIRNSNERFADYTRVLKEENQKLNRHVERVLQMAMLDKGELKLNKTRLNLVDLIQSVIKGYRLQIEKTGARVDFTHDEKITFAGDEGHLLAVFNNLLDNALKYTGGNCHIEISAFVKNKTIDIRFKDNGIGIEAGLQEKVFEKFFRASGGNLHDVKGFGLGLSYVKSIVQLHAGSITLISNAGKGSEFILQFKTDEQGTIG